MLILSFVYVFHDFKGVWDQIKVDAQQGFTALLILSKMSVEAIKKGAPVGRKLQADEVRFTF